MCVQCPYYDADGSSPEAFVKGSPACKACGCNLKMKTRDKEAQCGLTELGLPPKW